MIYYRWKKYLDDRIEVIPLELAGRAGRHKESFYPTFEDAVYDLSQRVEKNIGPEDSFAIFGHSMGSWLAFEINHLLQKEGKRLPFHLILSGRWAPHIKKANQVDISLPEKEFMEQVLELGGTPKEVLEDEELRNIFLPIFKEDLRLLENYSFTEQREPLTSDFSVFTGIGDSYISQRDLSEWSRLTNGMTKVYKFKGDHFFINSGIETVTRQINRCLLEA